MEKILFNSSLFIHVIAGILSLVAGGIAMGSRKKGGKLHNRSGVVFYYSMMVIFITTLFFFIIYPEVLKYQFFLSIGIVSFYPNFAGKRILCMKKAIDPKWFDFLAAFSIGISGICMLAYGFYGLLHPEIVGGFAYLFLVFAVVSLLNAYTDLKLYFGKVIVNKQHWIMGHAGKMTGAYAAAFTAFCVNIVPRYLPANTPQIGYLATWILPGIIIGVLGNRIKKQFAAKKKIA